MAEQHWHTTSIVSPRSWEGAQQVQLTHINQRDILYHMNICQLRYKSKGREEEWGAFVIFQCLPSLYVLKPCFLRSAWTSVRWKVEIYFFVSLCLFAKTFFFLFFFSSLVKSLVSAWYLFSIFFFLSPLKLEREVIEQLGEHPASNQGKHYRPFWHPV